MTASFERSSHRLFFYHDIGGTGKAPSIAIASFDRYLAHLYAASAANHGFINDSI